MIKLLRIVKFSRQKIALLSIFRSSCGPMSPCTPCTYYSCIMGGCTVFITGISLAGGKCVSVITCTFHLSCHTRAVNIPLTPVFMSTHFNFCPKVLHINFLFGLTVPQQFIFLVHKSSNNSGDEVIMPTYSLCPMFSIVAARPVTVA